MVAEESDTRLLPKLSRFRFAEIARRCLIDIKFRWSLPRKLCFYSRGRICQELFACMARGKKCRTWD